MKATADATEIAEAVKAGKVTARAVTEAALKRIERHNPMLGAFTDVTAERALEQAELVDSKISNAMDPGPLAGVPFAVKNLYDIKGIPTRAGSKINRDNPPAARDATLVTRLEAAGAVLLGGLNMDEYAYGFTGENAHDGPSRNPHGLDHMTGGSSAGPAAAVAGGLVPLSLGSDTNGSIRVPASFCGLFGLKPTYGRLSRAHSFPFVSSLDHLGPFARSTRDLALAYDVMQGYDEADPAQTKRVNEPTSARLKHPIPGLRIAVAGDYFLGTPEVQAVVQKVAKALEVTKTVTLPDAQAARAAAFLITMAEGATLHLDRLRQRPDDFDPEVRDRLLAGTMLPAVWVERAQKLRRVFRERVLKLFDGVDAILAPATPMKAPLLGQKTAMFGGVELPVRPNLGIFTQPLSFIGLPVATVPVWQYGEDLPLGVQVIAAPWREDVCLRIAHQLETAGVCKALVAQGFAD
ncbi:MULTISPECIES: AtzE family amidohydrolase [unclassified Devosia]|uniref:AtzE family amidohydrolase n=1 Tax=unclassified Devosia TaxID=196773 RepID=UPI00086F65A4|nr:MULTISPECIES: AtzE family amidohydrolase [unclassified Devosia]MBN9365322.1 AtzE family amidohydrolase [Devosia sp.]ODS85009.1 MAG: amidase [Devosia sp. SCN 66-27]OJX21617.1 MAG: amidase [Devosia sp. 66-14]